MIRDYITELERMAIDYDLDVGKDKKTSTLTAHQYEAVLAAIDAMKAVFHLQSVLGFPNDEEEE